MAYFWSRSAKTAQDALAAGTTETEFYDAKVKTGEFFVAKLLPQVDALMTEIEAGKDSLMSLSAAQF